jgi:hypothetical protein
MYVRKKPTRSGSISVIIVDKTGGKTHYLKTIGVSSDEKTIAELYNLGKKWITSYGGKCDMFTLQAQKEEERQVADYLLSNVESILLNGTQLILNQVFHLIGFTLNGKRHKAVAPQAFHGCIHHFHFNGTVVAKEYIHIHSHTEKGFAIPHRSGLHKKKV